MGSLIAVAGILFAAAITPGPNNTIVLAAAARSGLTGALPPIAGVLAGSLALLALVWAGADVLFEAAPVSRQVLLVAGALYLAWLGGGLIRRCGDAGDAGTNRRTLPGTAFGVAAFQIFNPKSWMLVTTAAVAMPGAGVGVSDGIAGLGGLAAMMVVIPGLCLTLWACAGAAIADRLKRPAARRRFDRAMGGLLILSAALLLAGSQ